MAKFTAYVQTNHVGSRCEDEFEIPDEELADLTPEERGNYIDEYAREVVNNLHEWGWTGDES